MYKQAIVNNLVKLAGGNLVNKAKKHEYRLQQGWGPFTDGPNYTEGKGTINRGINLLGAAFGATKDQKKEMKSILNDRWHQFESISDKLSRSAITPQSVIKDTFKNSPYAKRLSEGSYGRVINNRKLHDKLYNEARQLYLGLHGNRPPFLLWRTSRQQFPMTGDRHPITGHWYRIGEDNKQ